MDDGRCLDVNRNGRRRRQSRRLQTDSPWVVFGLRLQVEERVTDRTPPYRKVWATEGKPNLIVIGPYQMGFEVQPFEKGSRLKVFINYSWPTGVFGVVLGFLFARAYAWWCTMRMANDTASHFKAINAGA